MSDERAQNAERSHAATFVLSTGRCGTQWLTTALAAAAGASARVEHEPLHNDYAPRRMLAAVDPSELDPRRATAIREHVNGIERTLEVRDYVETGHPCWSSIRWLADRFRGQVRVVHLIRHPVPTACSWLSHGAFVPPFLPHLPKKELITPFDAGVLFPEYREVWNELTPFEQCLYYWAEVNAFGLRLEREGRLPWHRVRYEDLFDPKKDALIDLGQFLGLSATSMAKMDRGSQVDRHRFALGQWPEPERIARHPRIAAVAEELGYRADEFVPEQLAARFL